MGSYLTPVGVVQNAIEFCSASTGLPWAAGIILTTLSLRALLLPVIAKSMQNSVKMANIAPDAKMHIERMNECKRVGDSEGQQQAMKNLSDLYESHGCNPLKAFIPVIMQLPIFIGLFLAIRKMANLPVTPAPLL